MVQRVMLGDVKVAEVCEEYIKELGERRVIVYPCDAQGRAILTKVCERYRQWHRRMGSRSFQTLRINQSSTNLTLYTTSGHAYNFGHSIRCVRK